MTASDFIVPALRLLLAVTFLTAGLAKLARPQQSIQTLRAFGVPRALQWMGALLAPLEVLLGLGFIFAATMRFAAPGAVGLLSIFSLGVIANLLRDRRPDCHCFGQVSAAPIGWHTLARNALLIACAGWLLVRRGTPASNLWTIVEPLSGTGRRVAMVAGALVVFLILHRVTQSDVKEPSRWDFDPVEDDDPRPEPARPLREPGTTAATTPAEPPEAAQGRPLSGLGLPVGAPAPDFEAEDLDGRRHSLTDLKAAGRPLLLVFSSPGCESCEALVPKLPHLAAKHAAAVRLILISRGSRQQILAKLGDAGSLLVLIQQGYEMSESFDCTTIPSAVLIGTDGSIGSPLATGALAVQELIAKAAHGSASA